MSCMAPHHSTATDDPVFVTLVKPYQGLSRTGIAGILQDAISLDVTLTLHSRIVYGNNTVYLKSIIRYICSIKKCRQYGSSLGYKFILTKKKIQMYTLYAVYFVDLTNV